MTIKRLLWTALLSLGLVAVGLGAFIANRQHGETTKAQVAALRLEFLRSLGDILAAVYPERSIVTIVLQTGTPSPEILKALADMRATTDSTISKATRRASDLQDFVADAPAVVGQVRALGTLWARSRGFADEQARVPLVARGNAVADVTGQTADMSDAIASLMSTELRQLADVDGAAFRLASLAATVWEFRDVAGRLVGTLQNAVGARKPMSADQRTALAALDAQVNSVWAKLALLRDAPATTNAMRTALDDVNRVYFGEFGAERRRLEAAYATGDFPYDTVAYREKVVPIWVPVLALRDATYAAGAEIIAQRDASSRIQVQLAYGAIAFVVLVLLLVLVAVQVRVVRPLAAMTDAMRQLSQGNLAVAIPGVGRRDEIGGMATAMQVFKDTAAAKQSEAAAAEENRLIAEAARREAEQAAAHHAIAGERAFVVASFGAGLKALAAGDLTQTLSKEMPGEYEQLRHDFNAALGALQATVQAILAAAQSIRSGTGEVSQAADDLSRRTEQQAASLEETAAALDEITATVRRTAEGATHASDVVATTKVDAERSGEVVRSAIEAMTEIDGSARRIANIIGVINEIAFQTNLLALNAGVEAARAGEAGKGFAVVASEVRALAQRSADAAKEIKALIDASSAQVGTGVDLVGQTGKALERIITQVADVNAVVLEITASAKEQATGLAEVNAAVNQMDQVTQQNAAMVEQSTAASHALAGEAAALGRMVARFQVEPGATRSAIGGTRVGAASATMPRRAATVTPLRSAAALRKADSRSTEPDGWEEF